MLLTLAASAFTARAQENVPAFRVSRPVELHEPLQWGDSLDFKGDRFTRKALLQSPADLGRTADDELMTADSGGCIWLEKPASGALLHRLHTRLRAERFMKGELKVTATVPFEVFVDGKSQSVSDKTQDSIQNARPSSVKLRLEPEKDCDVVIKLLAAADGPEPQLRCQTVKEKEFEQTGLRVDPDMKRRLSLHETAFGARVSSVSMSPDGRYLLMRTSESWGPNKSRTNGEVLETASGRKILHRLPAAAAWMPSGSRLYYTVASERGHALVVLDPATGTETIVADNIPEGGFRWSPDERHLIYNRSDRGEKSEGPLRRLVTPDDRIPGSRDRSYPAVYDLATGGTMRLAYGHNSVHVNDISPDGSRLLCSASREDITKRPFSLKTLLEIDMTTGRADTLVCDDAFVNRALYSPDGGKVLVLGSPEAFGGIGRNCQLPIPNSYDIQAFILDRTDRSVKPLTVDFDPSIESAVWSRDGYIYMNVTDKDCRHIYRCDPGKGTFTMLDLRQDVITQFSLAKESPRTAAYVGGGYESSGAAYLYDMKSGRSTLLADPMAAILDDIELGHTEPWSFTAADGTLIEGTMCLPPDFDPERKYPLIVYYYGGTTPTTRGITSPYSPQLFASRDYVVYVIQPSGAIGFGQEFSARHVNAWGDYTADEIIEGTKRFCQEHPFVDAERIGCLGASYGGFMTMYLQTKTDIFAAAASHAGISNVTSYWGEGYWGYSYNSTAAADSYPWSNPELFTEHGALFNADKINTPLLLLHGSVDTNVPIGESIQLYNALKILGKTAEFITVDGENHFISDYNKRVLWHNSIMAWFARFLQGSPEWWNDLYPERNW